VTHSFCEPLIVTGASSIKIIIIIIIIIIIMIITIIIIIVIISYQCIHELAQRNIWHDKGNRAQSVVPRHEKELNSLGC